MRSRLTIVVVSLSLLWFAGAGRLHAGPIEDPGGILYHLDAALGITLNGSNVAAWADQGPAGNDFAQANAAAQPLWAASSINGLPAVQFSGVDQELLLNTATGPQTFIAVTNVLTGGGLRGIWGGEGQDKGVRLDSVDFYRSSGHNSDGNDFANGNGFGVRVNGEITGAYTVGQPHVITETRGPNFNATTFDTTSIGEYYPSRDYHGDVAELIVYDHVLTGPELVAVENLLGAKYGIATKGILPPARGGTSLGTGTGALLGGDLTDPENDGEPDADVNYNATFTSDDEPGFGGGEYSFNVFDNQVGGGNAKWCCDDPNPGNPVDGPGHQLTAQIQAGPHVLTHFTITSSNDSPQRDPLIWEIQGSNDGVNFTTIHSQEGFVWTQRNEVVRFDAGVDYSVPAPYEYFRYSVTSTGSSQHALNELEYFGDPTARVEIAGDGTIGTANQFGTEQNVVTAPLTGAMVVKILQNKPTAPNPLHLAEVQAFETGTGTNVALAGTASQSSNYNSTFVAQLAIDDDLTNFQHTQDGLGQWWQVQLAGPTDLDQVTIHARDGCCNQSRTADILLQVFGDAAQTDLLFQQHVVGIETDGFRDVPLAIPVSGEVLATLAAPNTYVLELDTAPDSDQLAVPNPSPGVFSTILDINGANLEIELLSDQIEAGDTWTLLAADAFQGQFSNIILPGLEGGLQFDTSQLLVDGTLSVTGGAAAIPEPSAFVLAALALLGLACFGRRVRRR